MKLSVTDRTLPRYHLVGTLLVVLALSLALGASFLWTSYAEHRDALVRLEKNFESKKQERLRAEMASAIAYLDFVHSRSEAVLRHALEEKVSMAMQTAQGIYEREHGRRPEAEVKRMIIDALRPQRFFDGRGYFFIDDSVGRCILLPTAPDLEGTSLWNNQDDTGHYIVRGLLEAARGGKEGGFSSYRWYSPVDATRMTDKLAHVRLFAPYGWIIGTGDYLYRWEETRLREGLDRLRAWNFGDTGHFMVMNNDGNLLLQPIAGRGVDELKLGKFGSPAEDHIRQDMLKLARAGGGLLNYSAPHHAEGGSDTRSAYVMAYSPWKIIVIASIFEQEMQSALAAERNAAAVALSGRVPYLLVVVAATVGVALAASLLFSSWMRRLFAAYHEKLEAHTQTLEAQAGELRLAGHVFESSREGIIVTDPHTRILAVNPAFTQITGYTAAEVLGQTPAFLASGDHDADFYNAMWKSIRETGSWTGEIRNRRKDGTAYPEQISIGTVRGPAGDVRHYVGTFLDITERKEAEKRIRHLAEFDALTQLPNRALLGDRVAQAIALAQRSGEQLAVLFIDLDRFKNINDSLGHAMGDRILQEVASRLHRLVRQTDTVSRLGGDEFVVLITGLEHPGYAVTTAQKILSTLGEPYLIDKHELQITPSIGVAMYPTNGTDTETLLKNADAAMYHAKNSGRNDFQFFTPEFNQWVTERLRIENGLRHAIERNELHLLYQPQVDLASGRIVSCEALLRWQAADGTLIPPDSFIPVAEETGTIHTIGQWVLDEACRQLQQWDGEGASPIRMAINVAVPQLRRQDFITHVRETLARHGLPPGRLEIEVTESVFLDLDSQIGQTLRSLADLGVVLSLDDFGTGYSSLSYLKHFRFDVLKIDRSFVSELHCNRDDVTLIRAIVSIARDMSLATVAEGIETAEQQRMLTELGCSVGQGHHFSVPLPAAELAMQIRRALPTVAHATTG
ncbi:EAL domain-containing protein [Zoogloea sp.]|uniref:bifunctional diguanylate cyclase/phosphodiesterase n=1 Tax=Zoogloea sp. TaxID=49181 RepID=UPI0035B3EF50